MGRNVTTMLENDKVLSGDVYCFSNFYVLLDTFSQEILIVTTSKAVSFTAGITVQGDATLRIFEDTVATPNAATSTFNANRNFEDSSSIIIHESPTVSNDGTELGAVAVPAGTKKDAVGFDLDLGGGFILKPNTNYLMRITNESQATRSYSFNLTWFDQT